MDAEGKADARRHERDKKSVTTVYGIIYIVVCVSTFQRSVINKERNITVVIELR